MQHSIDLTSKLSFGAQPKGKVTRKEQNATADADGTAGMTAQFSSALNQAMQPKSEPHHTDKTKKAETSEAAAQALGLVLEAAVTAVDGSSVAVAAETICIHGDGENAVSFARALSDELAARDIAIAAPVHDNDG